MDLGQQYGAVFLVLALLGGALWLLRRRGWAAAGRGRPGRQLEVVDRLALSPQHSLHLVRAGDTVILLACSPGGCAVVRHAGAAAKPGLEA